MGLGPGHRPIAAGPGAPAVADFQGGAERAGEQLPGPSDVEGVPVDVDSHGHEVGVAGEQPGQ